MSRVKTECAKTVYLKVNIIGRNLKKIKTNVAISLKRTKKKITFLSRYRSTWTGIIIANLVSITYAINGCDCAGFGDPDPCETFFN